MSHNLSEGSAEGRAGNGRGPATAADAADVAGAGGPQAAVDVRRQQPHRHARRRPDRPALGDRPGEFDRGGQDDHL